MRSFTVYKHTSPSGNVYIGITSQSLNKRWQNGEGYRGCKHFYNAIKKYGWENIIHEVIHVGVSEEFAKSEEMRLITHYRELGVAYNICDGGDGTKGHHMTDEIRERMRNIMRCRTGELNSFYGHHHTTKTRLLISANMPDMSGSNNPMFGKPSPSKGSVWVNTRGVNKRISNSELQSYLDDGWVRGRNITLPRKKIPMCWISKHNNMKQIPLCELQSYLDDGWVRGMKNRVHGKPCKNKICINRDGINKFIFNMELQSYLDDGWVRGMKR